MTPSEPFPRAEGTDDAPFVVAKNEDLAGPSRESFRSVFETEISFVWNALRRLGVPERDRPDVAQELFIAVDRQLHRYDASRPLRPWLYAFALRCAADYRKRSANRFELLAEDETESDAVAASLSDDDLATRMFLAKSLARLDDAARALVVMYEIEGFSIAEIAAILDVPLQTAHSRLKAAREALTVIVRRLGVRREGSTR